MSENTVASTPAVRVLASSGSVKDPPPWFAEAVVVLRGWQTQGLVAQLAELRWARPFRQFAALDLMLVLLALAVSGAPTVRQFYREAGPVLPHLAALWDRQAFPSRSAVSRMLTAVAPELVAQLRPLFCPI